MSTWTAEAVQQAVQAASEKAATDDAYRKLLIEDPHLAIKQVSGLEVPESFKIKVVDGGAAHLTLVIPAKKGEELSEAELSQVAGGKASFDELVDLLGPGIFRRI